MHSVALVSPGLLPVPPILGGSVENVIEKLSEVAQEKYFIDIYGLTHHRLPLENKKGNITYFRFSAKDYSGYFKSVRSHMSAQKKHSIIQVENRPLFIPKTHAVNPQSKFICSLHSLDHIASKLNAPKLTNNIFKLSDVVLVYSKFVRDQLAGMFPEVDEKIEYIHLATDPDKFRPRWEEKVKKQVRILKVKYSIPQDHKVILFAGRVIPKKGVDILIAAMERILKEYPKCCLVIMGSNWFGNTVPDVYIKELHKKAEKLGKKIIFTNYIYPDKLPGYFSMGDVFVCPSQWDEPFGLVNVEAMASGVPVVASARGGIPEIVEDGVNGYLVKNEYNPQSFVKPILKVLKNPRLAETFGVNGRKKVEEYFNWRRAGEDLVNLWTDMLNSQ